MLRRVLLLSSFLVVLGSAIPQSHAADTVSERVMQLVQQKKDAAAQRMAVRLRRHALPSGGQQQVQNPNPAAEAALAANRRRNARLKEAARRNAAIQAAAKTRPSLVKTQPGEDIPPLHQAAFDMSDLGAVRARVLELINDIRTAEGLESLRINAHLQGTAQEYAQDMAQRGFFAHNDPDGNTSLDRIRASGYLEPPCKCSWGYATGENLAKGQTSPDEAVHDWMRSPGHRGNILNGNFTETGIGFYNDHWVQHFGTVDVK